MAQAPLDDVKACVFDAYGTLFDFASAARACEQVPRDAIDRLTALWRDKQLQYTWLRAAQDRHADFSQVTADALDFALETLAIERTGVRDRLMNLYLTLDVFPEVPSVLKELKDAGLRTAILSNGSPRMLKASVDDAEIGGLPLEQIPHRGLPGSVRLTASLQAAILRVRVAASIAGVKRRSSAQRSANAFGSGKRPDCSPAR